MADSTQKQISTKTDSGKQQPQKNTRSSGVFLVLFILLTMAAGGGGFYLWQEQQNVLNKQRSINSNLQQQLQNIDTSINKLESQLTINKGIIDALKNQQTEISDITQKAMALSSRGQREWILAEIDYLLRMANRRLQIGKDINSAIAAMHTADQRIYDLGDLNLFPVRKQLKKDIARLKTLHQVDVNGTAMAIDQMLEHLSSLPFKTINDEIKSQLDKPKDIVTDKESSGFVDSVIDTVMNIGDIKIHHRSLEPVTNAVQQQQLEQMLRSHLLAARLAILRYDQTQFTYDLKQSQNILDQYYNLSDNRVSQMHKDLAEFYKLNLSPALPNINSSWNLLQDAIAGKKLTQPKAKKQSAKKPPTTKPKLKQPAKVEAL